MKSILNAWSYSIKKVIHWCLQYSHLFLGGVQVCQAEERRWRRRTWQDLQEKLPDWPDHQPAHCHPRTLLDGRATPCERPQFRDDNDLALPRRPSWGCCPLFLVKSFWFPAITHWGRSWTCWPSLIAPSTSSCIAWCPHSSGQPCSPTSDPRPPAPGVTIFLSTTTSTKPTKRRWEYFSQHKFKKKEIENNLEF